MSMIECVRVHNRKKDGTKMRPATPTPDKHWAYMLMDHFEKDQHIGLIYTHDGIEVHIDRMFFKEDEQGFDYLMKFIKDNDLTYSIDREQCRRCQGHPSCVARMHE